MSVPKLVMNKMVMMPGSRVSLAITYIKKRAKLGNVLGQSVSIHLL